MHRRPKKLGERTTEYEKEMVIFLAGERYSADCISLVVFNRMMNSRVYAILRAANKSIRDARNDTRSAHRAAREYTDQHYPIKKGATRAVKVPMLRSVSVG
jgi:hypothetical protein